MQTGVYVLIHMSDYRFVWGFCQTIFGTNSTVAVPTVARKVSIASAMVSLGDDEDSNFMRDKSQ